MTEAGQGVGRSNGLAVFVKSAVIGDVVTAELTKVKKNYAFGRLLAVEEPSTDRIEAFCPYFGQCGGCAYGELSYDAQLALKEKQVRDKLIRLGGVAGLEKSLDEGELLLGADGSSGTAEKFDADGTPGVQEPFTGTEAATGMPLAQTPRLRPIIGMEEPFRYRNKATMPVWTGGVITRKGGILENLGTPAVGFYQAKSHAVVDCYDCFLQSEPAMAAAEALRQFMISDNITAYDPKWEKGLLRHLVVKTARGTGEVMVILVINGKGIPNAEKLVEMLDDAIYNLPPREDGVEYNLESVILNVNKAEGKGSKGKKDQKGGKPDKGQAASRGQRGGSIFGQECITLAGKPTILEQVGNLKFEISPLSFYQVNPVQMEALYNKAIEYADLSGDETVLDLYCGVGTIGLFAAREMERKQQERAGLDSDEHGVVLQSNGNDEFMEEELAAGKTAAVMSEDSLVAETETDINIEKSFDFVENRQMTMNAGRVIGIESVKEAVLDANRNAVINGIVNARYVCGKAEEVLPLMVQNDLTDDVSKVGREGAENGKAETKPAVKIDDSLKIDHADVVFLDPPRAGCDERLLEAVVSVEPERIVYVSCDPATLARDVKYLTGNGYAFVEGTPVDMFPWTGSIETVVLLSQQKPDDTIEIDLDLDELDATSAELKATYQEIKDYVLKEFGLKVSSLYISQVKRKCGIEVGENYNLPKSENARVPQCPKEKEDAIKAALKYYAMI